MLKHEDNPEIQSSPAAQVRVTPEELAAAISRLEARKDVSQRNLEGTVAIGEVVQQLGLDATPEEVLAEVQAGRQETVPKKKELSFGKRFVLVLGLAGILLGVAVDGIRLLSHDGNNVSQTDSSMIPISIKIAPNLTVGDASGKILMLSEVGDNKAVRCAFDNESDSLQYYYPNSSALWTLIKHNGKVYVRGWMLNVSEKVKREQGVNIAYNRDANFNVPVTLPLDGFKVFPQVGSIGSFVATDVHLDSHAYEKWQP